MKPKVYIDGQEGTTGLQIYDRLGVRDDIALLLIDPALRKDVEARRALINQADLVFLCLPDAAAVESVSLVNPDNTHTRIIDCSTAHRTHPAWAYGLPDLSPAHHTAIATASRVANPGCHATGAIAAVYPLVQAGILPASYPLTCFSLTGYSGGGKKKIADYEGDAKQDWMHAPALYALGQSHKHLPEITHVCGLTATPVFCPIIDDFAQGMSTTIMLHNALLTGAPTLAAIHTALAAHYANSRTVTVAPLGSQANELAANQQTGKDSLVLYVCGNDGQTTITALFDNLGKGASGAAVQNMNVMLGFDEIAGLNL